LPSRRNHSAPYADLSPYLYTKGYLCSLVGVPVPVPVPFKPRRVHIQQPHISRQDLPFVEIKYLVQIPSLPPCPAPESALQRLCLLTMQLDLFHFRAKILCITSQYFRFLLCFIHNKNDRIRSEEHTS